jgi:phosphatidylinositol-3-phosphatase
MSRALVVLAAAALAGAGSARAGEGGVPRSGFGRLDHVFLIIMENENDTVLLDNPSAPYLAAHAKAVNRAAEYFAVGHPSAPNYLELVGGSNFGLTEDYWPDWVQGGCVDRDPGSDRCRGALPPIAAAGVDNAVVATAGEAGQCNGKVDLGSTPAPRNCALRDYPAAPFTPKSIADQLVAKGLSWKTYQESLPAVRKSVAGVNYSDGFFSNLSSSAVFKAGPVQKLYSVKHNPFAYFRNIQLGRDERLSLARVADFDGPDGLWADLQSGAPSFSFIVPNQCHDLHGAPGGAANCAYPTAAEPGLLTPVADATIAKLVEGIKASPAWKRGRNALVLVWDENGYVGASQSFANAPNRVVMLVETNYARHGVVSRRPYDHFSLLRTLEAGFGLPCLNHACDRTSQVMDDVFGGR